jgi:NodT family efflux transporter outer membrane factor (OMF) lipoprotein
VRTNSVSRSATGVALLGVLLCTACLPVPDLGERPAPRAAAPLTDGLEASKHAATAWPDAKWWESYGDPQLTAMIEEALANSPSLDEAAARVRKAQAIAQQAGSRLKPNLDANAQGGVVRQSENLGLPPGATPVGWNDTATASLGLSYDLDLWGRNRATLRAALSEVEASRADEAAARLALSTGIASTYAELLRLASARHTAETDLRIRADGLRLIGLRLDQGLETEAAVERSAAARSAVAAQLAAVDEQIELVRNQLAALMGEGPARGQSIALPEAPQLRAFGLPTDLGIEILGRRPDIVAARLRTEALADRIKAARADFYPNVRLSAVIGLQALGVGDLFEGASTFGSAGPAISLPIFSGGRTEGAYRGARAEFDQAVAAYDQTLIEAVREIADVTARQRALTTRLGQSRAALASSQRAYTLVLARYRGGLSPYFEVLSAEDALNANRRAVADLEASAFTLDVALVRALGGGFRQSQA